MKIKMNFKRLFIAILLLLSFNASYAQMIDNTNKKDETNIYHHALTKYLEFTRTNNSTFPDTFIN